MRTAIVGSKFPPGGVAALSKLRKGAGLLIVREAENQHDPNAVAVYSRANEHLGYIPRSMNAELARQIDDGQYFFGVLTDEAIIDRGDIKFAPKILITRRE